MQAAGALRIRLAAPADVPALRALIEASDPDWARQGVGSLRLDACESAAVRAGFRSFELGAAITGERLYSARGYRTIGPDRGAARDRRDLAGNPHAESRDH